MVVVGGPSPKRRRTDNGPVSAESIAQANSTVQFFTGRQHRWVQGYIAPSGGNEQRNAPHVQTAVNPKPTVNTHGGQGAKSPKMAGAANESTHLQNGAGANLVQYEAPPMSNLDSPTTTPVNETSRKSMDRVARSGAPPSLPSPVSSDGNRNSPMVLQNEFAPRRGPGRPSISINAAGNAAVVASNASPTTGMHRRVSSHSMRQQLTPTGGQTLSSNQMAYTPASAQQPRPLAPTAPPVMPQFQQLQSQGSAFAPAKMRQLLDTFEKKEMSKLPYNTVDRGRLTLLGEAIDRSDMMYIVLSQLHSLTALPDLLPQSTAKLNPNCFQYLDMLLCPNRAVSPTVLKWLSNFPAPIMSVYSSSSAQAYSGYVQAINEILGRLPANWNTLVSDCKKRHAPPLMEDLCERLKFYYPVLQTIAFRAIARMVWDTGSEKLEHLHRMDQSAFLLGRRRSLPERHCGYQAYRHTMETWKEYEQNVSRFMTRQQHLPESQRASPPAFSIPQEAVAAFAFNTQALINQQVMRNNSPDHNASIRQQQAMLATAQRLRRPQSSLDGTASSAQTPTTPQARSTSMNSGNAAFPMPPQPHPPGPRLAFPHESEQPRAQPTQPDTTRSALHQAHLRSPILASKHPSLDAPLLYRYISTYAMSPRKINKDLPIETIRFNIPLELFARIPTTTSSKRGEPPTRILDETSQTVRLRCAAITSGGFPTEASWIEADNWWPDIVYLEFNGVKLEPRRKLHHNRCLPINLTTYIKSGENELTVIVNRMSTDTRPFEYALAVEVVGVVRHQMITDNLRFIKSQDSLDAIKKSLSAINEDDDIAITSSNLTIKLFEPYANSKIFDTPVRGAACLHKDCFDLETFLRMCKRDRPGWPTIVDCWRCPICRGDVRPHTLVSDGFLVKVRNELAEKKLLDTRAIVVEPDGSWRPKEEERTGVRSPSLEREERDAAKAKKVVEVIEID